MSWSKWVTSDLYGGCLLSTNNDGKWVHHLIAHPDEKNPDSNHVHLKIEIDRKNAPILASIKIDGMHSVNRRELIERINSATDLGLSYR